MGCPRPRAAPGVVRIVAEAGPQSGAGRIAGIDLNKPRIRAALAAALALAPAPGGFTVAEHAWVRQITG